MTLSVVRRRGGKGHFSYCGGGPDADLAVLQGNLPAAFALHHQTARIVNGKGLCGIGLGPGADSDPVARHKTAGPVLVQTVEGRAEGEQLPGNGPGHWVTVCAETETYAAKALAIDEEGRLVIQRENGRQEALRCGEVTTRPARTE